MPKARSRVSTNQRSASVLTMSACTFARISVAAFRSAAFYEGAAQHLSPHIRDFDGGVGRGDGDLQPARIFIAVTSATSSASRDITMARSPGPRSSSRGGSCTGGRSPSTPRHINVGTGQFRLGHVLVRVASPTPAGSCNSGPSIASDKSCCKASPRPHHPAPQQTTGYATG
jgi:hypothetical protein